MLACLQYGDKVEWLKAGHDYTIGTLDMLQACDACADMGMTYSVIVHCADCVVFPKAVLQIHSASVRC